MSKSPKNVDIAVVGAGPAGLTLAGLLARAGFSIALIDQAHPAEMAKPQRDTRTTALSYGTMQILDGLGVRESLLAGAAPITTIDVQDGKAPVLLRFDEENVAQTAGETTAMGWIVDNPDMRRILWQAVEKQKNCTVLAPYLLQSYQADDQKILLDLQDSNSKETIQLQAKLLIGADGRMSRVRDLAGLDVVALDYKQIATVGLLAHANPHKGLALERFFSDGPFAVLPFTDDKNGTHRSAVVWTRPLNARQQRLVSQRQMDEIALPNDLLHIEIERRIDPRYGAIKIIGTWDHYPLSLYHSTGMIADRVALVGDAAHAIHPIAGQGLNIGMQDIAVLVDLLSARRNPKADPGDAELLDQYQQARRFDVFTMVAATDLLNRFFGLKTLPFKIMRPLGLGAVNALAPLKRFFIKRAMGL
jgi:2-octaprenyl-6-methoxyphenol hydroxylase